MKNELWKNLRDTKDEYCNASDRKLATLWRRFYALGWHVSEASFRQYLSRGLPRKFSYAQEEWAALCEKAARAPGLVIPEIARSKRTVLKRTAVTLASQWDLDNATIIWLPLGGPVSFRYWIWRLGVKPKHLRGALKINSQWAVDFKNGVPDITEYAAVRWAWDKPMPSRQFTFGAAVAAAQTKYGLGESGFPYKVSSVLREALVEFIGRALGIECVWTEEFARFRKTMSYVRERNQAFVDNGESLPVVDQHLVDDWFRLSLLLEEKN